MFLPLRVLPESIRLQEGFQDVEKNKLASRPKFGREYPKMDQRSRELNWVGAPEGALDVDKNRRKGCTHVNHDAFQRQSAGPLGSRTRSDDRQGFLRCFSAGACPGG